MESILYHYCSTQKLYGILSGKQLRMSDITKSNDYDEVYIMIADAQALTDNAEHPEKVRQNIMNVALDVKTMKKQC